MYTKFILFKDDDDDSPSTTTKKLLRFFDTGCYDGFDDSSGGFYAVYRNLFERLDEEEELEELTNTYHTKAASFGGAHVAAPSQLKLMRPNLALLSRAFRSCASRRLSVHAC